jgi:hypothetical protein
MTKMTQKIKDFLKTNPELRYENISAEEKFFTRYSEKFIEDALKYAENRELIIGGYNQIRLLQTQIELLAKSKLPDEGPTATWDKEFTKHLFKQICDQIEYTNAHKDDAPEGLLLKLEKRRDSIANSFIWKEEMTKLGIPIPFNNLDQMRCTQELLPLATLISARVLGDDSMLKDSVANLNHRLKAIKVKQDHGPYLSQTFSDNKPKDIEQAPNTLLKSCLQELKLIDGIHLLDQDPDYLPLTLLEIESQIQEAKDMISVIDDVLAGKITLTDDQSEAATGASGVVLLGEADAQ